MITIWRDKILGLKVLDTTELFRNISGDTISSGDDITTIRHKFFEYGIYQDVGTGRGYKKGNGGNLDFLDPLKRKKEYARKQKSGKVTFGEARQPRAWFSRSYFISQQVLKEEMAYMYGEEFCGLLARKIEEANHKRSTTLRTKLWG